MADEKSADESEIPCSNPYGVAGDIWEDHESDDNRILIMKCSPHGNWVEVGSKLKDK